jgi:hypothetical protein
LFAPVVLITKRCALENLLDHRVIEQTLQLGCLGELGSFGVDGIMEEHNELTVSLEEVRKITLFMDFGKIFLFTVTVFSM